MATGVLLLLGAGPALAGTSVDDSVQFELSQPEGLFGPGSPVNEDVLPIPLYSEHHGPVTEGDIVNVSQDVPVSVLQAAWSQALATCTAYTYTVSIPTPCGDVTISPTTSECITGHIGTRTVSTRCCVNVTHKYPNCDFLGSVSGSETVNVNKTLPVAIGPYPTQPLPRDTNIGARLTYSADVDVGMELALEQNAGRVDLTYGTDVRLQPSADAVPAGGVLTLVGRHVPDPSHISMSTEFPSLDLIYRYFYTADARLDLDYAHMDEFGQQTSGHATLLDFSTATSPHADDQGRVVGEFVSVKLGTGGAEVGFMRNVPYAPEGLQDQVFQFPLVFNWDVTSPFTCPQVPILSGIACAPPPLLSWDIFEVGIRTPEVNTPVGDQFDPGVSGFLGTPVPVLRNAIGADGSVTNTAPSRWRPLVAGLLGDLSQIDLKNILVDDARLSGDFTRLDFDLDYVLGLAAGVPPPASAFGVNFSIPTSGIDPATGVKAPTPPLVVEANALDIDLANWFSIDQTLVFRPNLLAVLHFDKPVSVRLKTSDPWQEVTQFEWPLSAGADSSLEIQMPAGGLTITPTYSLRNNVFSNDTRWYYTPGWQTSYLQLSIQGFIATFLDAAFNFNPNFALFQSTFSPGPIQMGTSGSTSYTFDHFSDVTGSPLVIAAASVLDADGDGVEDSSDNCPAYPNPSQSDVDGNGMGDLCECGDQNGDGRVDVMDLIAINLAIFGSVPPSPLCDTDNDGLCAVSDIVGANRRIFGQPAYCSRNPPPGP